MMYSVYLIQSYLLSKHQDVYLLHQRDIVGGQTMIIRCTGLERTGQVMALLVLIMIITLLLVISLIFLLAEEYAWYKL